MYNNIAVIADTDFLSGFKALGCSLYPVDDKTKLRDIFNEAAESNFLFIFILENFASKIMDLIEQYSQVSHPIIIPLPDFRKDLSLTEDLLSRLTKRATGTDIQMGE